MTQWTMVGGVAHRPCPENHLRNVTVCGLVCSPPIFEAPCRPANACFVCFGADPKPAVPLARDASLRDLFAAFVAAGILSCEADGSTMADDARACYEMADALLAERERVR